MKPLLSFTLLVPALFLAALGAGEGPASYQKLKAGILVRYATAVPRVFSPWQPGIKTRVKTDNRLIALTFDACGTPGGKRYDRRLIEYLVASNIPATLFISGEWIQANPKEFRELAANPLFEIENHGFRHKPLSVRGMSKYNIPGTRTLAEAVDEVALNAELIESITGRRPLYYRSGTAYLDDVAVKVVYDLGMVPLNFSISSGDAEPYLSPRVIADRILTRAKNGAIVLCHMNHPERNTLAALRLAVPELKKRGYSFIRLKEKRNTLI